MSAVTQRITEERVTITKPDGESLAGILAYPSEKEPVRAVLVCSPHPHFAGDLDNNVVRAVSQRLAEDAITLRFDYRGVGRSTISLPAGVSIFDYWEEVEEQKAYGYAMRDVEAAGAYLRGLAAGRGTAVVGYSFGAIVGLQYGCSEDDVTCLVGVSPPLKRVGMPFLAACRKACLLLAGAADFVCPQQALLNLGQGNDRIAARILCAQDHFFRGEENVVAAPVIAFVTEAMPPAP